MIAFDHDMFGLNQQPGVSEMRIFTSIICVAGIVCLCAYFFFLHIPDEQAIPKMVVNKDFSFDVRKDFPNKEFEEATKEAETALATHRKNAVWYRGVGSWLLATSFILTSFIIPILNNWQRGQSQAVDPTSQVRWPIFLATTVVSVLTGIAAHTKMQQESHQGTAVEIFEATVKTRADFTKAVEPPEAQAAVDNLKRVLLQKQ